MRQLLSPRSPNIVVGPVFVTVEPPNTEKLAAEPRPTVAEAPRALLANSRAESSPSMSVPTPKILLPTREAGRRLTARESPESDSSVCGTPLCMGVS
jgi:hypothetical protein